MIKKHGVFISIILLCGLLATSWIVGQPAQPVQASESSLAVSFWMITVRGDHITASVICDGGEAGSLTITDGEAERGWALYSFEADLAGCQSDLVDLRFDSVFPQQSLGFKIKGVTAVYQGIDLVINGCFDEGLDSWQLDPLGWSWSVPGGTKNVIPGVCSDNQTAAKHGPVQFSGEGVAGVSAGISQPLILGPGQPDPTSTPLPPTSTPEPTSSPPGPACYQFYNHYLCP